MFPRRFFPGRYFAPVYFPQSEGEAVEAGGFVCGTVTIYASVGGAVTVSARVGGTSGIGEC